MAGSTEHQRAVRVDGVPVRLFIESQDHQHDLIRELQLIEIGGRVDSEVKDVSLRLAELISAILSQYHPVRSATREQAEAALARGDEQVSLLVPVHPGMAEALREWLRLLEEADELCRRGELLLLASRDEIRDLRRRYVEVITRALDDSR